MGLILVIIALVGITGCDDSGPSGSSSIDSTKAKDNATQKTIMQKAQTAIPVPVVDNFIIREQIAKFMERVDQPNMVWRIYILGENGQAVRYYTAQSYPVSICVMMSAADEAAVIDRGRGNSRVLSTYVRKSPGIDGVYYAGADCEQYYFFDAQTDAMHVIKSKNWIASDQPLNLDAEPVKVLIDDMSSK